MVAWCIALVPALILFFVWFLDPSLPWLRKSQPCRGPFLALLPVAGVSWLLLALSIRDAWRARRRAKDEKDRPPRGS
jgi:hypothetical protein